MTHQDWQTPYWPKGVSRTVKDYKFPLFHLLDESARKYPDNVFTIFAGASKTYAQVKDTADRIANFLVSRGIKKGDSMKFIRVNLTAKSIEAQDVPQEYAGLGGRALTSILINKEVPATCDPLGPDNVLIFAPGLLTGLPFSGASRSAVARSILSFATCR